MRRTALIGVSLTLLMLLLVLSAAFIFLFQGRQLLVAENESVSSSLAQTQQELDVTYDTLDASGRTLATAQATNLLLEGQLVDSQQEVDSAIAALATREVEVAEAASERDQLLSQPPAIEIIAPAADDTVVVGETVEYDLFVADSVGITAVIVSVDDEQIGAFSLSGDPTERITGEWTPSEVGTVTLGVQASNARTSILETQTVTVVAPTGQIVPIGEAPFRTERLAVETAVQEIRQIQFDDPAAISVSFQTNLAQQQASVPVMASLSLTESLAVWSLFDLAIEDFFLAETGRSFLYDLQQDTLNINGLGATFDPIDAYDYAGAYAALLLDQSYTAVDSSFLPLDSQLALSALVAGDVANVQTLFKRSDYYQNEASADLEETLQNREYAPYEQLLQQGGLAFATFFSTEDSLSALNSAWQSPPATTEQLFHPEKYLAQETAVLVTLPDLSTAIGEGWSLLVNETAGELMLRLYLSRYLNESQVETAVSGWGGDRFAAYQNEDTGALMLVLKIEWDTVQDSNEFAALYPNYPTRLFTAAGVLNEFGECWDGEDVICLFQNGIETAVVRAQSVEIALSIAETMFNE